MRIRSLIAALALIAAAAVPATAVAATASAPETRTYDLDFTLPTAGKSGCTVCHSDPALVKADETSTTSIYVDTMILGESAHKDTPCTGCHIDFAYEAPHDNVVANGEEWRDIAKLACKNCHTNEFTAFANGVHSPATQPGEDTSATAAARAAEGKPTVKPLCGDCHGGHAIPSKEDSGALAAYQASAMQVCGQCHVGEAENYADYYHGAAYAEGAPDAPACWDCHGDHEILPADNRKSLVHRSQLTQTCAGEGACHKSEVEGEVDEKFIDYAEIVHGRYEMRATVPFWSFIESTQQALQSVVDTVGSWFE